MMAGDVPRRSQFERALCGVVAHGDSSQPTARLKSRGTPHCDMSGGLGKLFRGRRRRVNCGRIAVARRKAQRSMVLAAVS